MIDYDKIKKILKDNKMNYKLVYYDEREYAMHYQFWIVHEHELLFDDLKFLEVATGAKCVSLGPEPENGSISAMFKFSVNVYKIRVDKRIVIVKAYNESEAIEAAKIKFMKILDNDGICTVEAVEVDKREV